MEPRCESVVPPHGEPVLAVGQVVRCLVQDLGFGGEGVARVGGMVVFVPYVIPGEEVEVEIQEVKKQYARGALRKVWVASGDRVEPKCSYYGACGGCQYQHLAYDRQLEVKRKQVGDLLQRVGGFDGALVEVVRPCPRPYGYRNRLMVRSQWSKVDGRMLVGFLRESSRLVVDVESCAIGEPMLNEQLLAVRAKPPHKGGLKVVLRVVPEDFEVPPDSFFQNNFFMVPALVEAVRGCLSGSGVRYLIDAYCGVGFFGLSLAGSVERFLGVELDQRAIAAARRNATRRGVMNGEFVSGDASELLPGLLERVEASQTAVVLDPPRTGCHGAALEALLKARPRQVIYVSCHPATLARDLAVLREGAGYRLERVIPVDMFPQTQHVECVADMRLPVEGGN